MNSQRNLFLHFISLIAVFILGDLIITLGYSSPIMFLAPILLTTLFGIITPFLIKTLNHHNLLKHIFFLAFAIFSLVAALLCTRNFIGFAKNYVLPESQGWMLSLLFAAVLFVFIRAQHRALLKFSLLSCVLTLIVLILFFVLSYKNFESVVFSHTLNFTAPLAVWIPIMYLFLNHHSFPPRHFVLGGILGAVLLFIGFLNAVLIFGTAALQQLQYPYADAISTITVGSIFTRMDGFAYIVFFLSALIKCGVCLKCAKVSLEKSSIKSRHLIDFLMVLLVFGMGFI